MNSQPIATVPVRFSNSVWELAASKLCFAGESASADTKPNFCRDGARPQAKPGGEGQPKFADQRGLGNDRILRTFPTLVLVLGLLCPGAVAAEDAAELDRQLLEALEGQPSVESLERIIPRLIDGTRAAAEQIEQGDLGENTARVQNQILADLDALLAQSAPPQQTPQNGSSNGQSQKQQQASQSQQQSQDPSESQDGGPSDPNAASRESEERSTRGEEGTTERERRLGLSTAAWGHLPPKVRERMRSAFSEEYLPEYDALVRRYYEALARRRKPRE